MSTSSIGSAAGRTPDDVFAHQRPTQKNTIMKETYNPGAAMRVDAADVAIASDNGDQRREVIG
jgi:hypothetical protein